MATTVTVSEASGLPDLISAGRQTVEFGLIPGVQERLTKLQATGGAALNLKLAEVTVPGITFGQVRFAVLGFTLARPGHFEHQNRFTVSFFEDQNGGSTKTLLYWMNNVRDFRNGNSNGTVLNYAVPQVIINTHTVTGAVAYAMRAETVWPLSVTLPPKTDDEATPARITAEFSMDWFGLDDDYADTDVAGVVLNFSG